MVCATDTPLRAAETASNNRLSSQQGNFLSPWGQEISSSVMKRESMFSIIDP